MLAITIIGVEIGKDSKDAMLIKRKVSKQM